MNALPTIRAAFVIGRRDFTATVFSKAFLFFLLGPLFPIVIGLLFGGIGANIATQAERPRIAVIGYENDIRRLEGARARVAGILDGQPAIEFVYYQPAADESALRQRLLTGSRPAVVGVLTGGTFLPKFIGSLDPEGPTARQLRLIVGQAQVPPGLEGQPLTVTQVKRTAGRTSAARTLTAHAGQALLFLLTLLLAGMLLSQLIEEKSNKVIEVLAAAVPVDAIFLGKLFAMLAMSLLGIAVWASAAVAAVTFLADPGTLSALPAPALGWPGFMLIAIIYFAFGYLLIGAAFLGVGAQASTVREVQTLSMPITMSQVVIFAIAAAAASNPDGTAGIFAAVFPLSSPYAMLARAALDGRWWPHLLAIAWQALWLAVILRLAAAYFRRSVLKSGPKRRSWLSRLRKREPRPAAATARP
jgi:ABC-2 type transport system permease protein